MRNYPTCLLLAVLVCACGSDPVVRAPAVSVATPSANPSPGPLDGGRAKPAAVPAMGSPFADPRLDPIRDKVPLVLRPNAVTAAHLANDARPTREEKRAIRVWQEIRDRSHQNGAQPSHQLLQTRVRVTRAITQLYAGQLTYAEFARRVREIDLQHQAHNGRAAVDLTRTSGAGR